MSWQRLIDLGGAFSERFPSPSRKALEGAIKALKEIVGQQIPTSYSQFLDWTKGRELCFEWNTIIGDTEPGRTVGIDSLCGMHPDDPTSVQKQTASLQGRIPRDMLVVGDDAGGNKICLSVTDSAVYFWDHETSDSRKRSVRKLASSFESLVNVLQSDRKAGEKHEPVPKGLKLPRLRRMGRG